MGITREKVDELYEHYNKTNESHAFFENLISIGFKHVAMIWDHGKIEVQAFIDSELVAYEFEPYDNY